MTSNNRISIVLADKDAKRVEKLIKDKEFLNESEFGRRAIAHYLNHLERSKS
jgi:Arc/MetJ-type ribon-helix-helix transcriptional regulator